MAAERLITPTEHAPEVIRPEHRNAAAAETAAGRSAAAETVAEQRARQAAAAEQARRTIAEQAPASAEQAGKRAPAAEPKQRIDSAAKAWRMRQSLSHVQKRLTPAQKSLSDFIHQPLVRRVSESTAETIARPSGILGGGLCAFLGTSAYLWFARAAGITYNYLGFFVFFAGGFLIGLVIEHGLSALRRR